jgi:alkylation response protein AidB-like acyl-CoA dehydrogenase
LRNFAEILAACDALAANFATRADQHDRDGSFAHENAAAMRAAGLCRITVAAALGGDGLGLKDMAQVLISIARGDASTALGLAMHVHIIGQMAEQQLYAPEIIDRLCAECVSPGIFVNNVASEPEMGSPSRGGLAATTATPVVGGLLVNGRKSWVTYAPALDYFLTTVTIRDGEREPIPAVVAIHKNSAGIEFLDNWGHEAMALRASGSCDVVYRDVFVPTHWLIEKREPGQTRSSRLPPGWSGVAFSAIYLGVGEAALHALARFAAERVPTALGKPIATLAHVQRNVGRMQVALAAAKTFLLDVARTWDKYPQRRAMLEADLATAKYLCTNAAIEATDIALRTAGASGLDRRLPLERLFRDARAGLMHPPQDEAALMLVGRKVIGE